MQALTYSTMTDAVPSRRAAVLVMLTACGLNAVSAGAATIDAANLTDGGLLDAIMPNVAAVLSETHKNGLNRNV